MTQSQQEILNACLKGDRLAQKQLYDGLKGKMYAVCLRYADSREDAEDIMQDGFVTVFRDMHQYKGAGSFEGWVRKVIVNVALQNIRKKKGKLIITELENMEYKWGETPSFYAEGETSKGLVNLMQKLPTGFRTVLNLYVLEGWTHIQIADELGISVGTSKSQLSRAKTFMKNLFENSLSG